MYLLISNFDRFCFQNRLNVVKGKKMSKYIIDCTEISSGSDREDSDEEIFNEENSDEENFDEENIKRSYWVSLQTFGALGPFILGIVGVIYFSLLCPNEETFDFFLNCRR